MCLQNTAYHVALGHPAFDDKCHFKRTCLASGGHLIPRTICRKHDDGEEEGVQEPQGAITVTETFPDGTSNPEHDSYPRTADNQAHAPGAACICILAGPVRMQTGLYAKTSA